MGLSPAASRKHGIRHFRIPCLRPKRTLKIVSTGPSDTQPKTAQSTVPQPESAKSQALAVKHLPKQFKKGRGLFEQARSVLWRQKLVTKMEITSNEKGTELIPTSKSEIEETLKNQAAEQE